MPFGFDALATGLTAGVLFALALAIAAWTSVVRSHELTIAEKTVWVALVALVPILGASVYFGTRSDW